ncbi:hypothetical protein C8R47DRAFT_1295070 [Mycena vitilis]|nr:hypothetical protein C8R47DRAFT_1295070 [Mycena vitilis]
MRLFWLVWLRVLLVVGLQTNHSIDDAGALVQYSWLDGNTPPCSTPGCPGSAGNFEIDASSLHNGTFTEMNGGTSVEFNFTGVAVYIFVAVQSNIPTVLLSPIFYLDNVGVYWGNNLPTTPPAEPQYNASVYANQSIPNGPHTFKMAIYGHALFDYAVYTYALNFGSLHAHRTQTPVSSTNDPDPTSSTKPKASPSAHTPVTSSSKKKPPVGAIVGGVVGAVALIVLVLGGLTLARRAKYGKGRYTSAVERSGPRDTDPVDTSKESWPQAVEVLSGTTHTSSNAQENLRLGEQVRLLTDEILRLKERADESGTENLRLGEQVRLLTDELLRVRERGDASSTAASETASMGRSVSTMKREQTHALQQHRRGSNLTESTARTDRGVRSTAGRAEEEMPPNYVAD